MELQKSRQRKKRLMDGSTRGAPVQRSSWGLRPSIPTSLSRGVYPNLQGKPRQVQNGMARNSAMNVVPRPETTCLHRRGKPPKRMQRLRPRWGSHPAAVVSARVQREREIRRFAGRDDDRRRAGRLTATACSLLAEDQSARARVGDRKRDAEHPVLTDGPQVALRRPEHHAGRDAVRMAAPGPCGQPSGGKPHSEKERNQQRETDCQLAEALAVHLNPPGWSSGGTPLLPCAATRRSGPSPTRSA